jgi:uncharacterized MnhB-related membrane protein
MTVLHTCLLLLAAMTGTGVVLSRRPGRRVMAMAANGLVLAMLFMAPKAPDVAFSELAVGTVTVPLLLLVVLASTRIDRRSGRPERQ